MSLWMSLLNNVAVSVFGSVLAASFCDALDRRKNRIIFWICIALIPIAQGIIYYVWEDRLFEADLSAAGTCSVDFTVMWTDW